MDERFLNNYVVLGDYDATGEGMTQWLRYSHYQKDPFDMLKDISEYHRGACRFIKIRNLLNQEYDMAVIRNLSPTLHNVLLGKKQMPGNLVVNVTLHQNYS